LFFLVEFIALFIFLLFLCNVKKRKIERYKRNSTKKTCRFYEFFDKIEVDFFQENLRAYVIFWLSL